MPTRWTSKHEGHQTLLRTMVLATVLVLTSGPAATTTLNNIRGNFDLTAVQSQSGGTTLETLRQSYSFNWTDKLAPLLTVRGALRFYRFDLDRAERTTVRQQEVQPFGEIVWNHPRLNLTASARRRRAKGLDEVNNLRSDNLSITLRTKATNYPLLSLRYNEDHIFNPSLSDVRDSRDRSLSATVDYNARKHSLNYSYTRRKTDNIITDLETTNSQHWMQWTHNNKFLSEDRLGIGVGYTFNYRATEDNVRRIGHALRLLSVAAGLFSIDQSPSYGSLEPLSDLVDGRTDLATDPPIDIGQTHANRNIGIDLGFEQPLDGIYISTDRSSEGAITWDIYTSADNLNWERMSLAPSVTINNNLNRFEILFPQIITRYIKAVKSGFNNIERVLVTEIQVLAEIETVKDNRTAVQSHLVDLNMSYRPTAKLSTSSNLSYQREPVEAVGGDRDNLYYTVSSRYLQSRILQHSVVWQQGFQEFGDRLPEQSDYSLSYRATIAALEALEFSVSLSDRQSHIGGVKDNSIRSARFRANGAPSTVVNLSVEGGLSRNEQFATGQRTESRSVLVSLDGDLARTVSSTLSYRSQVSRTKPTDRRRTLDQYSIDCRFRATRTIFLRSSLDITRDNGSYVSQEYLLAWRLTPKLSLSSTARLTDDDASGSTDRYSARISYSLSSRTEMYFSYDESDLSDSGGSRTTSLQAGLRSGF